MRVRKENTKATRVRQSVDDEAVEAVEARCGQVRPEGAEVVLMARYEETHVEIAGKARSKTCAAVAFCLSFATSWATIAISSIRIDRCKVKTGCVNCRAHPSPALCIQVHRT